MEYQSPPVGHEISAVFHGVHDGILNDVNFLRRTITNALKKYNFSILGEEHHIFEPRGYTCMWLLGESDATIHTYPEHGSFRFGMYSCRGENDCNPTLEYIKKKFGPRYIDLAERKVVVGKPTLIIKPQVKEESKREEELAKERGWL
ncbi:MAG: S-adenosylmethionine decarboxylase [Nanoarchaeota archaeon]|nr:S-adenosylmethionine decarboxylase [Nanoarchaeota archaeon]